jgi:peptidyl-prolyl cis-trans isomerase C
MKTPEGKQSTPGRAAAALAAGLAAAGGAALHLGRFVWRLIVTVARACGKLVATIWRLAGALDDALWRGTKLSVLGLGRILAIIAHLSLRASHDFLGWLPSRSGRAYSAFSAFILIIALLWIADELNIDPQAGAGAGEARPPGDLEDPILARIEGRYVHLSEIVASARASGALRADETVTPHTAFERQLVQTYVEQKLLSRAAIDDGLQRDQTVTRQVGALRDRILAAAYMEKRIQAVVTDEAIENLYSRQSDVTRLGDEVRARHIVVASREDADMVIEALKAGGAFEELARKLSIDRATAAFGGDLGYFARDNSMTPELVVAAFSTPVGDLAPPFETEFGWHVLEVLDRRPTKGIPLAEVKDNIALFLRRRAIADILAELQEDNEVVYYDPEATAAGDDSSEPLPAPPDLRPGGL